MREVAGEKIYNTSENMKYTKMYNTSENTKYTKIYNTNCKYIHKYTTTKPGANSQQYK